jgi:hypothetical protein
MAIMTRSGRAALADAIRQRPLHLAWGTGTTEWDSTAPQATLTFGANDVLELPYAYVSGVALASADGTTTYAAGTDYTVDSSTGRITRIVTGGIPSEATVRVDYTIDTPPPDVTQTSLLGELGRRAVDEVAFVVADDAGAIVAPTGRFTLSATPTNHLFVRVRFEFEDAPDAVIREQGLFVGTTTNPALPAGLRYFEPAAITDPGILLIVQNTVPIIRQPSTRETFEFVVTF